MHTVGVTPVIVILQVVISFDSVKLQPLGLVSSRKDNVCGKQSIEHFASH